MGLVICRNSKGGGNCFATENLKYYSHFQMKNATVLLIVIFFCNDTHFLYYPTYAESFFTIIYEISKAGATRCKILRLKCIKYNFHWRSVPDPAGGACSAPPAVFHRPTSKQREKGREKKRWDRECKRKEK